MTVLKFDEWRDLMRKIRDSEEPDRLKQPGVVYPAREVLDVTVSRSCSCTNAQCPLCGAGSIPSDSEAE